MGRVTDRRMVLRLNGEHGSRRPDTLVVEEPLEIRLDGEPLAVTMRTPGDDLDLALGFLLTEGIIHSAADVRTARHCAGAPKVTGPSGEACQVTTGGAGQEHPTGRAEQRHGTRGESGSGHGGESDRNVVEVVLASGVPRPAGPGRNFYMTSSCGMCGKASIDAVRTRSGFEVADDPVVVDAGMLASLPDRLRTGQRVFDRTGGLHAAGLFDAAGTLLCLREDVGRHNAVDKVIGWAVRDERLPLGGLLLMVSGRAGFELVQKAGMAGIPLLAAVSAPSTLAVDLARELGMTLAGFVRGDRMNIYAGAHRIHPAHPSSAGDGRRERGMNPLP